jgi:phospholipase/carboxylesterase
VSARLDTVEIETGKDPQAAVIWLHGLGADGHDFEPIVPALGLPATQPTRFVFPHAPFQPVTINAGAVMRAWYDIYDLEGVRSPDELGLRASQEHVERLVSRERERGIAPSRLVLAGFSQGGALALQTGLRYPERLAGIMGLSTYLPLAHRLGEEASPANRDVPIFLAHGTADPLIPLARARASRDRLRELGYGVEWREYPIEHAVCPEEIHDLSAWLRRALGADAIGDVRTARP